MTSGRSSASRTSCSRIARRWRKVREAAEAGAYDAALWRELTELGWPGIAVAEEHGGQGLGAVELAVLLEELGYACAATPFLSSATAAAVIAAAGTPEQQAKWLPGLASGELTAGIGTAELAADAVGAAVVVLVDGADAVLIESPDGPTADLDRLDPAVCHRPRRRRAAGRRGGGADSRGDRRRGRRPQPARAGHDARLRQGPQAVRRAGRLLPGGLTPLRADAALHRERPVHRVLRRLGGRRRPRAPRRGGGARGAAAADGGREVTASAIQAHGGIGFTWEADVHWLYKRAQLDSAMLGGARRHREVLARAAAERVAASAH